MPLPRRTPYARTAERAVVCVGTSLKGFLVTMFIDVELCENINSVWRKRESRVRCFIMHDLLPPPKPLSLNSLDTFHTQRLVSSCK